MIRHPKLCHVVVCDGCGADFEHDYTPHYDDPGTAREMSVDYEWRTDGERDWCTRCQTLPHECAPDPEDRAACARCGSVICQRRRRAA